MKNSQARTVGLDTDAVWVDAGQRCITHGHGSAEATAALADLEAAEAAEERARAPVNFPKNYAFSKNGTHLYAHTVAGWHGTKPENATISGDKEKQHDRPGAHGRQQA